jgi:hypothetical protein
MLDPSVWRETSVLLPAAAGLAGKCAFTGKAVTLGDSVSASELFVDFPVAVLETAAS